MLKFAFYNDHNDIAQGEHFRETRVNVGYSFNALLVIQAKHGDLNRGNGSSGGGEKGMDEGHL